MVRHAGGHAIYPHIGYYQKVVFRVPGIGVGNRVYDGGDTMYMDVQAIY